MAKRLTKKEWAEAKAPFTYMGFRSCTTIRFEIAAKWIETNCSGWYYYEDDTLVFESDMDASLFRLWAEGSGLNENGEVV